MLWSYSHLSYTVNVLQHRSSHLVFEWYISSSASRQSPCSKGPTVSMSTAMAIQPSNFSGENKSMHPIVMATGTAAQSLGKLPRGWGIRASCSRGHCICQEGKDRAYRKIDTVEPVNTSVLLKSKFGSGILKFIIRSNKLHGCGCLEVWTLLTQTCLTSVTLKDLSTISCYTKAWIYLQKK